jgi:hypothetical protein
VKISPSFDGADFYLSYITFYSFLGASTLFLIGGNGISTTFFEFFKFEFQIYLKNTYF